MFPTSLGPKVMLIDLLMQFNYLHMYLIKYVIYLITIFRFSIELDKSRELEIGIYWKDWRSLCAVKFLRLEEFIDDVRHGMALQLEPQGLLFAEIKFLNPMISRKPKLQRQRKIFKQQVKNFPRANQMNINVATWGRLLKRSAPSLHNSRNSESPPSGKDSNSFTYKTKSNILYLFYIF